MPKLQKQNKLEFCSSHHCKNCRVKCRSACCTPTRHTKCSSTLQLQVHRTHPSPPRLQAQENASRRRDRSHPLVRGGFTATPGSEQHPAPLELPGPATPPGYAGSPRLPLSPAEVSSSSPNSCSSAGRRRVPGGAGAAGEAQSDPAANCGLARPEAA